MYLRISRSASESSCGCCLHMSLHHSPPVHRKSTSIGHPLVLVNQIPIASYIFSLWIGTTPPWVIPKVTHVRTYVEDWAELPHWMLLHTSSFPFVRVVKINTQEFKDLGRNWKDRWQREMDKLYPSVQTIMCTLASSC